MYGADFVSSVWRVGCLLVAEVLINSGDLNASVHGNYVCIYLDHPHLPLVATAVTCHAQLHVTYER